MDDRQAVHRRYLADALLAERLAEGTLPKGFGQPWRRQLEELMAHAERSAKGAKFSLIHKIVEEEEVEAGR